MILPRHKTKRLQFSREHADRIEQHYGKIIFADDTRIELWKPDGRGWVYKRLGIRFTDFNLAQKISFGGCSIMLWVALVDKPHGAD